MVHQFHTEIRREDSYDECAAQRERESEIGNASKKEKC